MNVGAKKINNAKIAMFSAMGLAFAIPISTTLTYIMLAVLLVSPSFTENFGSYLKESWQHPIARGFVLFFLLFVMGVFYSDAIAGDIIQQLRKMSKLLAVPLLIPLMKEKSSRDKVIAAFVAAMILTLSLSFLKVYAGLPLISRYTEACVFKNHIESNLMMALAAFFLGHYALTVRHSLLKYSLFGLIALMTYYILGMSEGRSGYLIFIGLWMLFLIQRFTWKKIFCGIILLSLAIGTIGLGSRHFRERMVAIAENMSAYQQGLKDNRNSLGTRFEYIISSVTVGLKSPILGAGTGAFKKVYREYAEQQQIEETRNPHNEYMNIFVQFGFVGLIAFLMLLGSILKHSYSLEAPYRFCVQGLLLAFVMGSLANSWLMDFTPGYLFMVLFAVAFGNLPKATKKTEPQGISVIVTTYNWPEALKSVLKALAAQRYSQFEIIIADDGSREDTGKLIADFKEILGVPVKHVWQPDQGFRAAAIRNKAIQAAVFEYIIFLDGDCIPRPDFLEKQASLAEKGFFVVGNRILLNKTFTQELLSKGLSIHHWSLFRWFIEGTQQSCNRVSTFLSLPLGPLRKLFPHQWKGAKGCNLAVWKHDLKNINGWEEQFHGWGYEDSDLVIRLLKTGIKRKSGRFAIPVIHLWHAENDRSRESENWQRLMKTFETHKSYVANNGLDQYSES